MCRYRIGYEPRKADEGCPWFAEDRRGERTYWAAVALEVRAQTVLVPGPPRQHGYLECEGVLIDEQTTCRIVPNG